MDWLKNHWKEVVIGILVIFGLNKCTQSCNRQTTIDEKVSQITVIENTKDSVINVLNDSIGKLNIRLQVYEEKVAGLNQALSIQDEANKRISEAKKNINVQVRQK
jgi:ribosomal protein S7